MTSINPAITALHAAYNHAMGLDLPMNAAYERWYFEALAMGLTTEHLEVCIQERIRLNRIAGTGFKMKLGLWDLIHGQEDVARVINEAEVVLARRRVKVMPPNKASVLRATGRSDQMPQEDAQVVGDLMEKMRKAAQ